MGDAENAISDIIGEDSFQEAIEMVFDINIALKMIPSFFGVRAELHKFITCCEIVSATATTRNDVTLFLNVIKTKLEGSAYDIVKYKNFDNWQALKQILEEQYLERRTLGQIQTDLINCRQNFNEETRAFANRIDRLRLDLDDACIGPAAAQIIQNLNRKTALKVFVEGLRDPIKPIVKASRFDDFNQAVEAACEEERTRKSSVPPKQIHSSNSRDFNSRSNSRALHCNICGRNNHHTFQCYSNSRNPSFPRNVNRETKPIVKSESINKVSLYCNYCKNQGHTISECRKREFNHGKFQTNSKSYYNVRRINVKQQSDESVPSENSQRPGISGVLQDRGQ